MTHKDAKHLAISLAKAFPMQVTDGQAKAAITQFINHDRRQVEAAITRHRQANSKIDWPQLFTDCAERPLIQPAHAGPRSFADIARRQSPCLRSMNDPQVILCAHRHQWRCSSRNDAYRRKFAGESMMLLMSVGYEQDYATRMAETIFDESPEYFRQVIDELNGWQPLQKQNQVEQALAI